MPQPQQLPFKPFKRKKVVLNSAGNNLGGQPAS